MNNFPIFVSSSDSYSDIWDVFFDMFQKFWPEYDGTIYLQTQEKEYHHEGLNIVCTQVGKLKGFGATLRAGLDKVKEDNLLFIMIDYLFMGKVDHQKIKEYYDYFLTSKLDTLCLFQQSFRTNVPAAREDLIRAVPPCDKVMFGYQIAFWKKELLKDMGALPHENPWMSEWYGSMRAEKMRLRVEALNKGVKMPIPYDARGCLHQGKWLDNAVEFLNKNKYKIDFNVRGHYVESKGYGSLSYRLRIKYIIWKTGFLGSYWDLLKRKPIH